MICLLSTELYKCYAVKKDCIWLDAEDVSFNSHTSVDSELATHGIYSIGGCVLILRVVAAVAKYERDLEPVTSSSKAHAVDKTFFFRHADLAGMINRKYWTWNWLLFCQKNKVLDYTAVNF